MKRLVGIYTRSHPVIVSYIYHLQKIVVYMPYNKWRILIEILKKFIIRISFPCDTELVMSNTKAKLFLNPTSPQLPPNFGRELTYKLINIKQFRVILVTVYPLEESGKLYTLSVSIETGYVSFQWQEEIIQGCTENLRKEHGIMNANVIDNAFELHSQSWICCWITIWYYTFDLSIFHTWNSYRLVRFNCLGYQTVFPPRGCRFMRTSLNSVSISSTGTSLLQIMAYRLC